MTLNIPFLRRSEVMLKLLETLPSSLSRIPDDAISFKPPGGGPRTGYVSLALTIRLLPRRANPRRYELQK